MSFALALNTSLVAERGLTPCEAYGSAEAVFIGEASAPVRRPLIQDGRLIDLVKVSPVMVERSFRGVSTSTVYIMPAGIEIYLVPGEKYLIYGREYNNPDMFMSTDAYGSKRLSEAEDDLRFLEMFRANDGATISGFLELDESDSRQIGTTVSPLANNNVRLFSSDHSAMGQTFADGGFELSGLSPGSYAAEAQLPSDLILADEPTPRARVLAGGCASLRLRAIPNGHVAGVLRMSDGRPDLLEEVSLMPAELRTGQPDGYFQQVRPDTQGRFTFQGVRPGRYLLGRLTYNLNGVRIPAVYYPGTPNRDEALPIVVGRGATQDVGDFYVPTRD